MDNKHNCYLCKEQCDCGRDKDCWGCSSCADDYDYYDDYEDEDYDDDDDFI